MSALTPIPAELRAVYYDALLAGRAEAERLGYGPMADRVFAAFHRALYAPMVELISASAAEQERARIAAAIEIQAHGSRNAGRAERWHALRDAAAIARTAGATVSPAPTGQEQQQ